LNLKVFKKIGKTGQMQKSIAHKWNGMPRLFSMALFTLHSLIGWTQINGDSLLIQPFEQNKTEMHGYYLIPGRVQNLGLEQWKESFDCFANDSINAVIFWIPGSFRSNKFPETWQYNTNHKNVQNDFYKELINYAHKKGIKVILGFSPFAYDGVNQYPYKHPVTRAKNEDGTPINEGGIFCFGYSLCPAIDESQQFMFEYVQEMVDDFYPNADGLFIESTDYGKCQCDLCKVNYYNYEFEFVKRISDYFWAKKPDAPIIIYPHYFTGNAINTLNVKGIGGHQAFDERWSLFFTPHSTDINTSESRNIIKRAQFTFYYDPSPIWGNPAQIKQSAKLCKSLGITYFPTFEGYEYLAKRVEYDNDSSVINHHVKPFGLEWLSVEKQCYNDPLIRLNRIAYRVFYNNPELPESNFKEIVKKEMFGERAAPTCVDDLFFLENAIIGDRQSSYFFASPLIIPKRLFEKAKSENWDQARIDDYLRKVSEIRKIAQRHSEATDLVEIQLKDIANYIVTQWDDFDKIESSRKVISN
jgi:hypothetical protein